jgi:UDP-N-acetylmuramoyl-L-alanyl-D-glutamate--2,6-diaminopimelate ligase
MARAAEELSDRVVLTSDNPRTESPQRILAEMRAGLRSPDDVAVIEDRAQAIDWAIRQAAPGDLVLLAGKGHEDYQIVGTTKLHFDDREQARAAQLRRREGVSYGNAHSQ